MGCVKQLGMYMYINTHRHTCAHTHPHTIHTHTHTIHTTLATHYMHTCMYTHSHVQLSQEYLKEPLTSSAQMIYTLCRDQEKTKLCVDTICK